MNLTDQTKDLLLTRSLLLQRVGNQLTKDITNQYIIIIDDILSRISRGDNISIVNMNKIIKELNSTISPNLKEPLQDLFDLGVNEASFISTGLNGLIGIDLVNKLPSESAIKRIVNSSLIDGLTINEWLGKQEFNFKDTLTKQIRLGVIDGETNAQLVSRLKSAFNINNRKDIESLMKTAVATVTSQVRQSVYKENEEIFKGYEHNSTIDSKTTFICANRDGAEWDLNFKGINKKGKENTFRWTPLHFNCRSIILPITKSYKELGLDIEEIPVGTRSSMDGRISADITFGKWFESKSKSFQEDYLGVGRYKLYKDGKITLSDLVNQNGRYLKLSELNSKYS